MNKKKDVLLVLIAIMMVGIVFIDIVNAIVINAEYPEELMKTFSKEKNDLALKHSTIHIDTPLIPQPQLVVSKGFNLTINDNWAIGTDISDCQYNFSANWLKEMLRESNSIKLSISDMHSVQNNKRIILGSSQHPYVKKLLKRRMLSFPSYLGNESYILEIFQNGREEIIIVGFHPKGVFYGVQTLLQLINEKNIVEGFSILDYPDFKYRGVYSYDIQLSGWPLQMTDNQKEAIDDLAKLKINTILYPGSYDFFYETNYWLNGWLKFINYTSERFIEVIPSVDSLRHNSGPFYLKEGWWVKDEKFTFENDVAIADIPFTNLLYNGDFEIDGDGNNIPDGWAISNNKQAKWSWDNTTSLSGNYSMQLNAPDMPSGNTSSNSVILITHIHDVEPNSFYLMTAWIKSQEIGGYQPQITFYSRDNGSTYALQSSKGNYGTNDWRKSGVCIKTSRDTSSPLTIYSRIQEPGYGTFWIDNICIYRSDSSLKNVIRTNTTDVEITNLDKTITYINGIDYKIIDGETTNIFDEELQSFQIHRISTGGIDPYETVLVSYNSVCYWNRDHYDNQPKCVSDPRLYEERYYPAINKVITYLNPKIINLHSDEIRGFNRDSRNVKRNMSNAELITEWLNKINTYVKSLNQNCRIMMWDDMLSPYHNGGVENYQINYGGAKGRMAEAVENKMVNDSIIMNIWWYSNNWLSQMDSTTRFFRDKGFDYFVAPYRNPENIQSWSEIVVDKIGTLGAICTPWYDDESGFPLMADHFWNTRNKSIYFDSFEKDKDQNEIPDNWFKHGNPEYSIDGSNCQGSRYAKFPNCAVKVTGDSDTFYSIFINVTPNKKHILSAYIKRDESGIEKPVLKISWHDENQNKLYDEKRIVDNVTDVYKYYEIDTMSPINAYYLRIYLEGQKNGEESFWFDTIHLKIIKTPIVPKQALLIGFIRDLNEYEDFTCFNANLLLYSRLSELDIQLLSSDEEILVAKPYLGFVRSKFVLGWFNSVVILNTQNPIFSPHKFHQKIAFT
jgi:hypothetical protein